ncbi:MAG: histidine kinase [Sphingomonas bacterium]|nr:histidine kinase [Sphingomonas bacterium]
MSITRLAAALLSLPLERTAATLLSHDAPVDFTTPVGEPALIGPDSVSWRIFRNPLTMFIGGVTAVLLELGEPRVRSGVWEHSGFRADPARRLRRTGMAAMVTVYGARSRMEALAARVRAMHGAVSGTTPAGEPYRADDPELLRWVQGTAAFAFLAAYRRHVRDVPAAERDLYYAEGSAGSLLYAAEGAPASEAEFGAMLRAMMPRLEPSPILDELLAILRSAPILPPAMRPLQRLIVRAAVDLVPAEARARLRLGRHGRLTAAEAAFLHMLGRTLDHARFPTSPAAQACVRLGLPADYLVPA